LGNSGEKVSVEFWQFAADASGKEGLLDALRPRVAVWRPKHGEIWQVRWEAKEFAQHPKGFGLLGLLQQTDQRQHSMAGGNQ
jgi:hypothetical protein